MKPQTYEMPAGAIAREKSFIREVFTWMGGGLAVTGLVSFFMLSNPNAVMALAKNPILFFGIIIVQLILVWQISRSIQKFSAQTAGILFTVYAGLNGVIFSTLFLAYTSSSIAATFFITAGVFGATALYGWTTKADLSSIGSLCFMGLIGIIIASIVNIFLRSTMFEYIISYLGVAIFIGLTAYDMQQLKIMNAKGFQDSESMAKISILGALKLYLDFINLFLFLLRLFGQRR